MLPKLTVLFLCTGNACRSQMAEGWVRALHGDHVRALSAGIEPTRIDPRAIRVMDEAGVDISAQRSKHVDEYAGASIDWVVTVCDHANERCPVFPGATRRLHSGFDDPPRLASSARTEEEALVPYRDVRDRIRGFVERLPETLQAGQDKEQVR